MKSATPLSDSLTQAYDAGDNVTFNVNGTWTRKVQPTAHVKQADTPKPPTKRLTHDDIAGILYSARTNNRRPLTITSRVFGTVVTSTAQDIGSADTYALASFHRKRVRAIIESTLNIPHLDPSGYRANYQRPDGVTVRTGIVGTTTDGGHPLMMRECIYPVYQDEADALMADLMTTGAGVLNLTMALDNIANVASMGDSPYGTPNPSTKVKRNGRPPKRELGYVTIFTDEQELGRQLTRSELNRRTYLRKRANYRPSLIVGTINESDTNLIGKAYTRDTGRYVAQQGR